MSDVPVSRITAHNPPTPMNWLRDHAQAAPRGHWDELRNRLSGVSQEAQPPGLLWTEFIDHLGPDGLSGLNPRMASLRRQVRDNGITYNIYAQADQPQRPWALDLFPLLISAEAWEQVEQGVRQRMQLLEHIMADAYGPQTLVARGLLPAALVQGHPGYLHAMHGAPPVGGHYLSLAAFDLARGPDGLWWLMSQRTQAPSGLGYLLENRLIISRLFPEAFEALPVQRLAASYQAMIDGLKARCPVAEGQAPHIALLTPGPYNETYFEHAYLARYLGLTLVQAEDLTVRDEGLFLKTLQGLQRVHGVLKRVDDTWLDPLELRSDSALGVPGLLQAVRRGQVLVANTPGSGFLESNALLGFMPALAQDILGEELVLPAIPSWWCGEAAALPEALQQLARQDHGGVVKPTYPSEGQRQGFEPRPGRQMERPEREEWVTRILRDPDAHTVQSWLPVSHQPVWNDQTGHEKALQNRPVILRVFAVVDAAGQWQVLPGGLARLGTAEGIASMQRGGSSADVWVQAHDRQAVNPLSLLGQVAATPRQRLVTSRSAENLFWMGRYSERTENTLRLAQAVMETVGNEARSPGLLQWLTHCVQSQGMVPAATPAAGQSLRVFERNLVHCLWDTHEATSVGFNLRALLRAASAVRERLSPEHWHMLEQAELEFFHALLASDGLHPSRLPPAATVQRILQGTSERMAALTGAQTDRMSRDDGWRLLSMGRLIERLEFLCSVLSSAIETRLLRDPTGFDAVLSLFDSTISFHAQYQQSRTAEALVELLVLSTDNPRSLGWVAQTLRSRLMRLEHLAGGATRTLAARLPAAPVQVQALWPAHAAQPDALLALLSAYRQAAREISEGLSALFFTHSTPSARSISH